MIPFGVIGILGDQFYLKGIKEKNLLALFIAKSVFPFEKEILVGPAHLYIQFQVITEEAKDEIKLALQYDPNSVHLLSMYTQYAKHFNKEYLTSFNLLKTISPNSVTTKQVIENFKNNRKD